MTKKTIKDLERQLANANEALEMALAVSPETDATFFTGGLSSIYNDSRMSYDRRKIFSETLRAWRVNPIARRIVRIIRTFIIGKGITITSDDDTIKAQLQEWWHHPLNNLDKNIKRWKDEDTRTGNLFMLCSIGESDNLYVRAIPSEMIEEIKTAPNDIEQELSYVLADNAELGQKEYPSYANRNNKENFIIHFASNQPVGSAWGESELSTVLVWIGRFSTMLEDRVRLNHFRTAIMYFVKMMGNTKISKEDRQKQLNANPPRPGTVVVTDESEAWGIMSPKLDSFDSNMDMLAIKKNIISAFGFPMHWFAEPEGSNKTTAEAAGTPTFRTLEESQDEFFSWIETLARIALEIKQPSLLQKIKNYFTGKKSIQIWVEGPDITERDNASLALAFARAYPALIEHYDREGFDPQELQRLVYKFLAEVLDADKKPNIKRKPLQTKPTPQSGTDPEDPQEDEEE